MSAWFRIVHGDVVTRTSLFVDNYFDACFCDPPYLLQFMGKGFDKQHLKMSGANQGQKMQAWHERWAREVLRVLKPGAYMLAFGGTRTYHRLASAVEDVGFEIFDSILGSVWLNGQGFPKSLDIGKAIDKCNGETGRLHRFTEWMRTTGLTAKQLDALTDSNMGGHYLTGKSQPAIPTPDLWRVLRPYCGNVPEWVDVLVARVEAERKIIGQSKHKPGIGNKTKGHYTVGGTEAKHVYITRPATDSAQAWNGYGTALKPAWEPVVCVRKPLDGTYAENCIKHGCGGLNIDRSRIGFGSPSTSAGSEQMGRYPANLLLSHHPDCIESGECHPDCPVRMLDEQSGITRAGVQTRPNPRAGGIWKTNKGGAPEGPQHGDSGGASRFFYCAKVSTRERNLGGIDCRHPTLKPISLTTYLARLLLPPPRLKPKPIPRRLLIPFSGAGSEIIGALLAGWDEVWGIEQDEQYIADAEARIAARHTLDPFARV